MSRYIFAIFLLLIITFMPTTICDNNSKIDQNDLTLEYIYYLFYCFNLQFNKSYSSSESFNNSFNIFRDNVIKNYKYITFKNNIPIFSEFYDIKPEEFRKRLSLTQPIIKDFATLNIDNIDLPDYFNWNEFNAVTEVKDQGGCHSCWAFSTVGNIEGQYAIKYKKLIEFSKQQLVDCDHNLDFGCIGGNQKTAMQYLINKGGLMTEEDYNYTGRFQFCKFKLDSVVVKIDSYYKIPQDEDSLQQALVQQGPIAASLNCFPLQYYTGGIFKPDECDINTINHGVVLVGYGEENGMKYWIIKNSWGKQWGEKGYFRLFRGENICGIAQDNWTVTIK